MTPYLKKSIIDTEIDFDAFYDSIQKEEGVLYRGESDDQRVTRSSLLRDFLESKGHDRQGNFQSYKKNHMQKNSPKIIAKFREKGEDASNDLQIEFAMQHYGFCTSLIDFTKHVDVALFFAAQKHLKDRNWHKGGGYMKLIALKNVINLTAIEKLQVEELYSRIPPEDTAAKNADITNAGGSACYDGIKEHLFYLEDVRSDDVLPPTTNERIEAQRGVMVYLSDNQMKSLEEAVEYVNKNTIDSPVEMKIVSIKRSLAPRIIKLVETHGITAESLKLHN